MLELPDGFRWNLRNGGQEVVVEIWGGDETMPVIVASEFAKRKSLDRVMGRMHKKFYRLFYKTLDIAVAIDRKKEELNG